MKIRRCVSHHNACDCREERFLRIEAALRNLLFAVERCEDNEFSAESRENLSTYADAAICILNEPARDDC